MKNPDGKLRIFLFLILILSCQSIEYKNFEEAQEKLIQLEREGEYNQAITLLEKISRKFPAKEYEISKQLALLYGKVGQFEKSFEIWEKGHQQGLFYGIFPHFPIYELFNQSDRFKAIYEVDDQIRNRAIKTSKTICEIVLPDKYDWQKKYPLFIILHGGGSSITKAKRYWTSSKINKEYIRIFIQSYLYIDMNTFGWKIKDERSRKEIRESIETVVKNYSIENDKVIIGGMSAGAYTAMDIAIHEILPVQGFVAVCPETEPSDYSRQNIIDVSGSGLRGFIITEEQDYMIAQTKEVFHLLKKFSMKVQLEILPDMGHQYPPDFGQRIDCAIQFILEK
jgi:tetratricopeptide (TPR) repeat protein